MEFYILGIPLSKFRGVFQRKKKKSSAHTAEKKEKKRVPSELRKHENSREEQKQEVKIIEEPDNVPVEIISADFEGTDIEGDSRKEATEGVCEFQNKDNENADKTSETTENEQIPTQESQKFEKIREIAKDEEKEFSSEEQNSQNKIISLISEIAGKIKKQFLAFWLRYKAFWEFHLKYSKKFRISD